MKAFVVDTNVLVVANGKADHASKDCIERSIDALKKEVQEGMLVLDSGFRILSEYDNNARPTGQPGVGDRFYLWALKNRANPSVCELVSLTQIGNNTNAFHEFPHNDPALAGFDPSDYKFVAVALKSVNQPEIMNAVDSDWRNFEKPLRKHGVKIRFLCPVTMTRKRGPRAR